MMAHVVVVGSDEEADPERKVVYVITCLMLRPDGQTARQRTWGWASKFEDAEDWVLHNATDMFEMGYYNLAVIEAMREGPIAACGEDGERWYDVTYDGSARNTYQVRRIDKPAPLRDCVSFGMG